MNHKPSLLRAAHLARRYRNWFALFRGEITGSPPHCMKLRKGPTIVGLDSQVQSIVREVWSRQVYGAPVDGVVIDVGGNVGVFSLYAVLVATHVHAFEPSPQNAAQFIANLQRNECENVTVHPVAIGGRSGSADLYLSDQSGGHSIIDHEPGRSATPVAMVSLAAAVDEHAPDAIALVKMDCEGAEGAALASLRTEHFARIDRFEIEYHDNASELSHDQVLGLLSDQGFATVLEPSSEHFGFIHARRPAPTP